MYGIKNQNSERGVLRGVQVYPPLTWLCHHGNGMSAQGFRLKLLNKSIACIFKINLFMQDHL